MGKEKKNKHGEMDKWMKSAIGVTAQQIFVSPDKYKVIACQRKIFVRKN